MKYNYQKEIDFLRALAVTPVILFHINPEFLPNGYLGVDLFFVISGFVITKTLLKEKNIFGEFKITSFFLRRVKRIYPALILMVSISILLIVVFGVLNKNNFNFFLKTGLFSIFGISNFFLIYKNNDYFLNQEFNPFTHTWSLGVEEQFYMIYPFILFFTFKFVKNFLEIHLLETILLIISLFSLYLFFFNDSIISNFYSPAIRFWELAMGCLAFNLYLKTNWKNRNYSLFFLFLLIFVYFFEMKFFSYQIKTFLVVISAFIFFTSSSHTNRYINNWFFENRIFLYIGKISYSLYLWHLPVIYFSNIYLVKEFSAVFVLLITLLLAHLSYIYVEQPFRKNKKLDKIIIKLIYSVPIFMAISIFLIFFYGFDDSKNKINNIFHVSFVKTEKINYVKQKFNLGNRALPEYHLQNIDVIKHCFFESTKIRFSSFKSDSLCSKLRDKEKLFILTGDCHAQHFLPMIDNSKSIKNLFFLGDVSLSTLSLGCLLRNDCNKGENEQKQYHETLIKRINELTKSYKEVILINKVFFTERNNNMNLDFYKKVMEDYLDKLNRNIKIIFIYPTPVFDHGPESCVILKKNCSINIREGIKYQQKIIKVYTDLENERNNISIYNPNKSLCVDENCLIYDHNTDFLYYKDNDNLSVEASKFLSSSFNKWIIDKFY